MLGKRVKVTVDRPLGTCHPQHEDLYYPVNYGYIEGIIAPDGEEQDAYILGVEEPVKHFEGIVIAVIHRLNDVEDKWVVASGDKLYSKSEIKEAVSFQERYFEYEIITTEVKFYKTVDDGLLKFTVIAARTNGKWVFCKHKERNTYEFPGGRREEGESIMKTAHRELYEETGATEFELKSVCCYSVKSPDINNGKETFGLLCFAEISEFEKELHFEIDKIILTDKLPKNWTYPLIQPHLLKMITDYQDRC